MWFSDLMHGCKFFHAFYLYLEVHVGKLFSEIECSNIFFLNNKIRPCNFFLQSANDAFDVQYAQRLLSSLCNAHCWEKLGRILNLARH